MTEDPIRDGENWFAYVGNNPVNWVDPWGLSASDGQGNKPTLGSRLKDFGRETVDALQDGVQWVWDNRKPLLEMGLGITMMYGGEGIKRSGQFFGITIATSGSIGTAGLGSPVAVGAGLTVGVSATAVGNMVQASGAALLAEGSRNLKGNDKGKNQGNYRDKTRGANKHDRQQIESVAKKYNIDRREFGDYIEEIKREQGMSPSYTFKYSELEELAKEFKELKN